MTATITPVARYSAAALVRQVDGEKVAMDSGAAPMRDLLQLLADRDAFALASLLGVMRGGETFRVVPGGTSTVFSMELSPFEVPLKDADGVAWDVLCEDGLSFTQAQFATLPNSAWMACFVAVDTDGTTLLPSIVNLASTGLDVTGLWREDGIGTHRFVGLFRTTSAGAPIPAVTVGRRTTYVDVIPGGSAITASDGVGTNAYVPLSLSSLVPPGARVATMDIEMTGGSGSGTIFRSGDTTTGGDPTTPARGETLTLGASESIVWNSFIAAGSISVVVRGYER